MTWLYIIFLVVFVLWLSKQLWCGMFGVPTFWCEMYDVDLNFPPDESSEVASSTPALPPPSSGE